MVNSAHLKRDLTSITILQALRHHPHQVPPTAVCGTQTMTMHQAKVPKVRPHHTPICNVGFSYHDRHFPKRNLISSHKQYPPLKSSERTFQPTPTLSCHCDRCGAAASEPQLSGPRRLAGPSIDDGIRHPLQTASSANGNTYWRYRWSSCLSLNDFSVSFV